MDVWEGGGAVRGLVGWGCFLGPEGAEGRWCLGGWRGWVVCGRVAGLSDAWLSGSAGRSFVDELG